MASSATNLSLVFTLALFLIFQVSQSREMNLRPFGFPIGKDPKTNLFYSSIGVGSPPHNMDLTLDLGGPFLWYDCDDHYNSSTYQPIPCGSKRCPLDAGCSGCTRGPFRPGCSNNTCGAYIINPLAHSLYTGDLGADVLRFPQTLVSGLLSGCTRGDDAILKGLPQNSKGIVGLARTKLSLPMQYSSSHNLPHKFTLCLPSSNKKGLGHLLIGEEPSIPHLNYSQTPLIVNPFSTAPVSSKGDPSYEYFLAVNSIKVGSQVLNFKPSLLSIDNKGYGGTKLSTMKPFTVLHSAIYNPLVRQFLKNAADMKMKKVAAVAPYGACFDLSSIGRSITGLDVPTIELDLQGGAKWTIYGGNSMILVNKKVACLGFVDGSKYVRTSLVIGGHVMEDNLLVFDLTSSKLSFTSSLLLHHATCSNIKV